MLHGRLLMRGRRTIVQTHHGGADGVVANLQRDIDRRRREQLDVSSKASFAEREGRRHGGQVVGDNGQAAGRDGRRRKAAAADQFGGDALVHAAFGTRIQRQSEVGVRLYVDEPRCHHVPLGLDDPTCGACIVGLNRHDPIAVHDDVGPIPP